MISGAERADGLRRSDDCFHPHTDPEREQVRVELREILASPAFRKSKRYAAVLEYLVDQTLHGRADHLKERTIGIDVFHRKPEYDTASDHVVRSAVAEVRKRLAQHYLQKRNKPFRIEVLPGSYIPLFRVSADLLTEHQTATPIGPKEIAEESPQSQVIPHAMKDVRRWLNPWWLAPACCVILLASAALWIAPGLSRDPFTSFWKPILTSHAPVLICIGDMEGGRGTLQSAPDLKPGLTLQDFHNSPSEIVNVDDAITVAKFAGLMESKGRQFEIKSQSDATFTDFQNGPTILIGLLNNNWSERLVPKLRFTVEHPSLTKVTIRDMNKPTGQDWSVDYATPYFDVTRDYALVWRMRDPQTDRMVVAAAGITVFGTAAAGDFLTDKNEMKKLLAVAPPGWEKKNMEIVLSTDVIRGRSGPATIVAAQFW